MDLNNLINLLGWTLINSLWQGLFILLVLAILLILIHPKYAKIRSMLGYASLLLVFAVSIRTFSDLNQYNSEIISEANNFEVSKTSNLALLNDSIEHFENSNIATFSWRTILKKVSAFANKNLDYIVILWLSGVFFLTLRMVGGYFYMQKVKKQKIYPVADRWKFLLQEMSKKINIDRTVMFFESALVKFPTVIGFFKPVILMPLGSLAEMPQQQVEMILAHELAHIKRADYMLNLIQSFLEIIYFFNPSVWLISRIIRNEREYACDDIALSLNNNTEGLVDALLSLHQKEIVRPVVALSILGTKNSLFGRIKRMVQKNNYIANYPKKIAFTAVLLMGFFTITFLACSSTSDNFNNDYNNTSTLNLESTAIVPPTSQENDIIRVIEPIADEEIVETAKISELTGTKDKKRKFNFNSNNTQWKGIIEDGKVLELYKDGEKVPSHKIADYEDFILDTMDELDEDMADFKIDMESFKEDMKQLKVDLANMKIDLDLEKLGEIGEHFNSDEFKNEMKELKHELSKIKDIDFDFDTESFKESMRELKDNLKDLKIDMSDLDIELSDLKVDLSELKVEMKKLKSFINELRADLAEEGYIANDDEDFDLELNKNEITVDGKKLPDNLHKRYLQMYKKHFGKELENNFSINN